VLAWLLAWSIELAWSAPEGCGDVEALRQELARYRLAEDPEHARAEVVLGRIAEGEPWSVTLVIELDGDRIERRFQAADCTLAISASALMIAVALDPVGAFDYVEELEQRATAPVVVEPLPPPPPEPEPEPEPELEPATEPEPRTLDLVAQLASRGALGPSPGFGAELFGSLGLRIGSPALTGRFQLTGAYAPPRAADSSLREDAGVRLWLASVGARGCIEPRLGRTNLTLPVCLGVETGVLGGRGFGLDVNRQVRVAHLAIPLDVELVFMPTRVFGLVLGASGYAQLIRPNIAIVGEGVIHQPSPVGARVWGGFEFRVPNDNPSRRRPSK
jgi:hypothetical protein